MKNTHGYCPHCGANWDDEQIGDVVYGRQIGIDGGRVGLYDGIVAWMCPDCEKYSPVNESPFSLEIFYKFLDLMQDGSN